VLLKRYPIALYLLLVVVFSAPFVFLLARSGALDMGRGFVIHSLMWAPGLAGIVSAFIVSRSMSILGLHWGPSKYVAGGYLLPIAYSLVAYLLLWFTGLAAPVFGDFARDCAARLHMQADGLVLPAVLQTLLTLSFGVVQSAASAAGEEIGWRGYLVPMLRVRFSFFASVILSGLIWASWHLPVILLADYHSDAPRAVAIACFTVMIVTTGGIAAWLRLRSGSVWPAIVFHAVHNAFIQWILDPMTDTSGHSAWYVGEFGIVLSAVTTVFAVAICLRPTVPADIAGNLQKNV
jgi:uncharacterized protein